MEYHFERQLNDNFKVKSSTLAEMLDCWFEGLNPPSLDGGCMVKEQFILSIGIKFYKRSSTASVKSVVPWLPPKSRVVRSPDLMTSIIAFLIFSALSPISKYSSI